MCMRASGALFESEVRNTAVPGTRCGGFVSSIRMRSSRCILILLIFWDTKRVPLYQVYITIETAPAKASDTQPPSTILIRLAARKAVSTMKKGAIRAAARRRDQFQHFQITRKAMQEVTAIVPLAAIP